MYFWTLFCLWLWTRMVTPSSFDAPAQEPLQCQPNIKPSTTDLLHDCDAYPRRTFSHKGSNSNGVFSFGISRRVSKMWQLLDLTRILNQAQIASRMHTAPKMREFFLGVYERSGNFDYLAEATLLLVVSHIAPPKIKSHTRLCSVESIHRST